MLGFTKQTAAPEIRRLPIHVELGAKETRKF